MAAFILTTANHVQAQISKGTGLAGLSFNYNSNKNNGDASYESSQSSYGFSPSYGVFIKQNLVVGGELNLSHSKDESGLTSPGNFNVQKRNWYGAGVYARQYKNLGSSGFYLFIQGNLGAQLSRGENYTKTPASVNTNTEEKGFNIQLGLYPGISYAVTPKFHIETGLNNLFYAGYSNSKTDYTNNPVANTKANSFNVGANIGNNTQWSIGARLLLGGKK